MSSVNILTLHLYGLYLKSIVISSTKYFLSKTNSQVAVFVSIGDAHHPLELGSITT